MDPWKLVYETFDPAQEKLRETLCTLGNGYFATRGAAPEAGADRVHYPGTYLAGGYNRLRTEISGHTVENEDLVNLPNWLPFTFRLPAGEWFDLARVELLHYRLELDLREGVLHRQLRFRDRDNRISRLSERRLVHMRTPHLAAQEITLQAENWSGEVEFRAALDGRIVNDGVPRYRQLDGRHLEPVTEIAINPETLFLQVITSQSRRRIALAARIRLRVDDELAEPERRVETEAGFIAQNFFLPLKQGGEAVAEKVVSLYNSRDHASSESGLEAKKAVARAGSFDQLLHTHRQRWHQLWSDFDLELEMAGGDGKERERLILRLHIFHLLQTASMHTMDLDVGIPSRGWHGEAYRGHIFWDELFVFPFLNLRVPEITRSLLLYRYRRLGEARAAAREAGLRGAMFPWQSGSNGREESQMVHLNPKSGRWLPDHTHLQRHVNAAVAYNVWQYFQATRDAEFLSFYGAEMVLEIARFWASLATWDSGRGRYQIVGVMGPDEYHDAHPGAAEPGLRNNSYTNVMAAWVLATTLKVCQSLPEDRWRELCETLDLRDEELGRWDEISRRMFIPFHGEGIISQFEGYGELEEFPWERYRERYGQAMRLDRLLEAEGDTPNRYQASKQADVLMLFYLFTAEELAEIFDRLDYPFPADTIPKNVEYYARRTSHGSTLSQVVHSWVLARLDRPRSWKFFGQALRSDIEDVQGGTTPEGIHLGAMASTVDLVQRGFTGLEMRGDRLHFNPRLPQEVNRLSFRIRYRGQSMAVTVTRDRITASCLQCPEKPIHICCQGREQTLQGGETAEFSLD